MPQFEIGPPRRERAVPVNLPPVRDAADLAGTMTAIIAAAGEGAISPDEGGRLARLVEIFLRAVETRDFASVAASSKPKFIVHGERDDICSLKAIREFYARAEDPKELVVIDAADHLFDGKVGEVADAIEDLLSDW